MLIDRSSLLHVAPPFLSCRRGCGYRSPIAALFDGCPECRARGESSALEVRYDYAALRKQLAPQFWEVPGSSLWQYSPLLPVQDEEHIVSLGSGNTPLIRSRHSARQLNLPHLYLKNEVNSPTASHKDRLQTVSVSTAHLLGYRRIVSISTGNFGAALAAHAAAGDLEALVLCPRDVPEILVRLMRSYGATTVVSDWGAPEQFLLDLLTDGDWFPSIDWRDEAPSNPFGVEGAKTIAFELWRQLPQGRVDAVLVPCASGDTLAGIAKGFEELQLLGVIERRPRLYGCQPDGAPALALTLQEGREEVVTLEDPHSIATSTREPTSSNASLQAIRRSGGGAPTASDGEIMAAVEALGREGFCVEPSSALSLACVPQLQANGELGADDVVVCLLTASGVKWPETLGVGLELPGPIAPTLEAFAAALDAAGIVRS